MQYLAYAVAVLGLLGMVASAIVVVRSRVATDTSSLWKAEVEALKARLGTVEDGEKQCRADYDRLSASYKALTDVVTAAPAIATLTERMDHNHSEQMKVLGDIARGVDRRRT